MSSYTAPLRDLRFVMNEIVDLDDLSTLPGCESATPDMVDAILEEAGKFAGGVLAPLNSVGDEQGATLENGVVRTAEGFADAYRQFVEGGWNSVPFDPDYGGQGLPWAVATALTEIWQSANLAWSLCTMLNLGAVEALTAHGSDALKQTYLEKLISGEWTGTMCLTEPHAGSDLALLRSKAERRDDGSYRISGTKIFITFGEHDMAENTIHLVLARTPDAPEGVRGISLFVVPKFLPDADGNPGERNDVRCVSIEHKLGIHASPTCVMQFGDDGGAVGYLVGEENRGLEFMFTMMNNARLNVGVQGYALSERAYQHALAYAQERKQGRKLGTRDPLPVALIEHPEIRRMLMLMKSQTEAMRALGLYTASCIDRAHKSSDAEARTRYQQRVDLLIPVVKGWSTDLGVELTSLGVQIHGGMGFIEETGAAQFYRDARIAPIYEGTNNIQAMDLLGRKLPMAGGEPMRALIEDMRATQADLAGAGGLDGLAAALGDGIGALERATAWLAEHLKSDVEGAFTGATNYLRLVGIVVGGWMMARSALAAKARLASGEGDAAFYEAKLVTARFYGEHVLPQAAGLVAPVTAGAESVMALSVDQFAA